jgi:hypothetical protein
VTCNCPEFPDHKAAFQLVLTASETVTGTSATRAHLEGVTNELEVLQGISHVNIVEYVQS